MATKSRKFNRLMPVPGKTFLLFGPRGTGKSTWVRDHLSPKFGIDLLHSEQFFRYKATPSLIRNDLRHLQRGDWVLVDEAQRVPELLNEIHSIYEEKGLHFAITGSSARKLKRDDANLLAGRALRCDLFPLVWGEIIDEDLLSTSLEFGTLPLVLASPEFAADTLASYVSTYLREEISAEALTRNLEPFARFLSVAAQHYAQMLNVEAVAREAAVKRRSVDNYFQILEETLIGFRLPGIKLGLRSKEATHPKFYLFDPGVARAAAGWLREPIDDVWRGFALEGLVLNELRAYNAYMKKEKNIFHYSVSGSFDIDFLVETKKKIYQKPAEHVAIEVKLAKRWRPEWSQPLLELAEGQKSQVKKCFGVYLGSESVEGDLIDILPFAEFSRRLWNGSIF